MSAGALARSSASLSREARERGAERVAAAQEGRVLSRMASLEAEVDHMREVERENRVRALVAEETARIEAAMGSTEKVAKARQEKIHRMELQVQSLRADARHQDAIHKAEVTHLNELVSDLRTQVADETDLRNALAETKAALNAARAKVAERDETIHVLKADLNNARNQGTALRDDLAAERDKVSELRADVAAADGMVSAAKESARELKVARHRIADLEHELEHVQGLYDKVSTRSTEGTHKVAHLETRVETLEAENGRLTVSLDAARAQHERDVAALTESHAGTLSTATSSAQERIQTLEKLLAEAQAGATAAAAQHVSAMEALRKESAAKLNELQSALHTTHAEHHDTMIALRSEHAQIVKDMAEDHHDKLSSALEEHSGKLHAHITNLHSESSNAALEASHSHKTLREEAAELLDKLETQMGISEVLDGENGKLKAEVSRLTRELESAREEHAIKVTGMVPQNVYREQVSTLTGENTRLATRAQLAETKVASLESANEELSAKLLEAHGSIRSAKKAFKAQMAKADAKTKAVRAKAKASAAASSELDLLRAKLAERDATLQSLRTKLASEAALFAQFKDQTDAQLESAKSQIADLEARIASSSSSSAELKSYVSQTEAKVAKWKAAVDAARASASEAQQAASLSSSELQAARSRIAQLEASLDELRASLDELRGARSRVASLEASLDSRDKSLAATNAELARLRDRIARTRQTAVTGLHHLHDELDHINV